MDILARDLELGGLVDGSSIGSNFQTWFVSLALITILGLVIQNFHLGT